MPLNAAIVAWAVRTPLGNSSGEALRRWQAGERAGALNPRFPAGAYSIDEAALVATSPAEHADGRYLSPIALHAAEAAREALTAARLEVAPERLGVFTGVGGLRARWDEMMPALMDQTDDGALAWERGLKSLHPYWMLRHLSNNGHALLAIGLPARGDGAVCAGGIGGAEALCAAIRALNAGAVEVALVVAYDSLVEPEVLVERAARGDRSVPGEAAAAVVLVRSGAFPTVSATTFADGSRGEPAADFVRARVGDEVAEDGFRDAFGDVGAAASIVQVALLAERGGGVCVSTAAPGLGAVVRVVGA